MSHNDPSPYDAVQLPGGRAGLGAPGGLRKRPAGPAYPAFRSASSNASPQIRYPWAPNLLKLLPKVAAPVPMDTSTPQRERARSPPRPINIEFLGVGFQPLANKPAVLVFPKDRADAASYLIEGVYRSPEFNTSGLIEVVSTHSESEARAKFAQIGDATLADAFKRRFEASFICPALFEHRSSKSMGDGDLEVPICECSVFTLFLHIKGTLAVPATEFATFAVEADVSLEDPTWFSSTTGVVPLFVQGWVNPLLTRNCREWDAAYAGDRSPVIFRSAQATAMPGLISDSRLEAAKRFKEHLYALSGDNCAKFLRLRRNLYTRIHAGRLHNHDPIRNRTLSAGEIKKDAIALAALVLSVQRP